MQVVASPGQGGRNRHLEEDQWLGLMARSADEHGELGAWTLCLDPGATIGTIAWLIVHGSVRRAIRGVKA